MVGFPSAARAVPAILDIDLGSQEGAALLAATAAAHGGLLLPAAHGLDRVFLLRSPWAPGLRFAGGQAVYDGGPDALCDRRSFSLSGPSETMEGALASVIGEGVEVLSQAERAGDVVRVGSLAATAGEVLASCGTFFAGHPGALDPATSIDWIGARLLGGPRLHGGSGDVLVPADWSLRRAPARTRILPPWGLGNGVAAGPDHEWAASRALLELIERDAVALWWRGGRRGRPISPQDPAMAEAVRLISLLRQDQTARPCWLLDVTTDIGVPCVVAASCDADGRGLAFGFGARLTLAAAVRAALLENAQMELSLMLARAKQAAGDVSSATLTDAEARLLDLANTVNAATCELLYPAGLPRNHPRPADGEHVGQLASALEAAGIEAALIDLTRPEFAIPVVRAVAPQLQPMPSPTVTDRLRAAAAESGGADRFTAGSRLF